jgi:hypothetical protein
VRCAQALQSFCGETEPAGMVQSVVQRGRASAPTHTKFSRRNQAIHASAPDTFDDARERLGHALLRGGVLLWTSSGNQPRESQFRGENMRPHRARACPHILGLSLGVRVPVPVPGNDSGLPARRMTEKISRTGTGTGTRTGEYRDRP